jgi:hypothetical protein
MGIKTVVINEDSPDDPEQFEVHFLHISTQNQSNMHPSISCPMKDTSPALDALFARRKHLTAAYHMSPLMKLMSSHLLVCLVTMQIHCLTSTEEVCATGGRSGHQSMFICHGNLQWMQCY